MLVRKEEPRGRGALGPVTLPGRGRQEAGRPPLSGPGQQAAGFVSIAAVSSVMGLSRQFLHFKILSIIFFTEWLFSYKIVVGFGD